MPTNCLSVFYHFVGLALKGLGSLVAVDTFDLSVLVTCDILVCGWGLNKVPVECLVYEKKIRNRVHTKERTHQKFLNMLKLHSFSLCCLLWDSQSRSLGWPLWLKLVIEDEYLEIIFLFWSLGFGFFSWLKIISASSRSSDLSNVHLQLVSQQVSQTEKRVAIYLFTFIMVVLNLLNFFELITGN